jgi:hypothetical protein
MANQFIDLTGQKFNRLTVIELASVQRRRPRGWLRLWRCCCDCGIIKIVRHNHLIEGASQSCGCLREEITRRHGLRETREYHIWCGMKQRCNNSRNKAYRYYGGRGIKIEWTCFEEFYRDMGPCPSKKHGIERKNNDGPYSAKNCIWATQKQQLSNTRRNRRVPYEGKMITVTEWAELRGIKRSTVNNRFRRGWTVEEVMSIPIRNVPPRK